MGKPTVYFISDGQGHCKIGVASDLKSRFNTLQVGSAYPLRIIHTIQAETLDDAYDIEREYHEILSDKRIRGEWFEEDAVEKALAGAEIPKDKVYMCDVVPEFDIKDALRLFLIVLESKSKEELADRYNKEMPKYWKDYDKWLMNKT